MENVISSERLPIKLWLDDLEEGALDQAKNLANLPFAFKHIAIMPDSHQGYGMPIGSVLATKGAVIPNAVGVDIGCGMCAFKTNITTVKANEIIDIIGRIKEYVPVGFNHHKEPVDVEKVPDNYPFEILNGIVKFESILYQLGTLGGGNHFIEIQKGSDGYIWVMIHSGSRNLGYKVAKHFNELAKELNSRYYSQVTKDQELAFLPINTPEAKDYFIAMEYCVEFALANRKLMAQKVLQAFKDIIPVNIGYQDFINKSHNFARWENHFKTNVIVHRKGATSSAKGERGLIPGSQGTKSYLVEGLGNKESFNSCSHGAGRVMGRKQATRELNLAEELEKINEAGVIVHAINDNKDLDEAPGSYKDIEIVMENQRDLAKIITALTPLAVVKG